MAGSLKRPTLGLNRRPEIDETMRLLRKKLLFLDDSVTLTY
jgi:hypothetical protein